MNDWMQPASRRVTAARRMQTREEVAAVPRLKAGEAFQRNPCTQSRTLF